MNIRTADIVRRRLSIADLRPQKFLSLPCCLIVKHLREGRFASGEAASRRCGTAWTRLRIL
jgi:hypothetical protein